MHDSELQLPPFILEIGRYSTGKRTVEFQFSVDACVIDSERISTVFGSHAAVSEASKNTKYGNGVNGKKVAPEKYTWSYA